MNYKDEMYQILMNIKNENQPNFKVNERIYPIVLTQLFSFGFIKKAPKEVYEDSSVDGDYLMITPFGNDFIKEYNQ